MDRLHVNADAASGFIKAEVLDENGNVIKGYSRDDCQPVKTDGINEILTWRNRNTLPDRPDKGICSTFYNGKCIALFISGRGRYNVCSIRTFSFFYWFVNKGIYR